MIKISRRLLPVAALALALTACKDTGTTTGNTPPPDKDTAQKTAVQVPATFNADSAYAEVATQVAFGPRTPGSKAQKDCAAWMQRQLGAVCDTVYRQETTVKGGDGKMLPCINLIGSIHPKATRRFLLLTHWDSRPWADQDTKDKDKPIMAADDAGSGVGVLIEVARAMKGQPLPENVGVDILFTDVEDYGRTEWGDDSYCLGTQYWALHPHVPGYKAEWGILLDMVGARGARFPMEQSSGQYNPTLQQQVWAAAGRAGVSGFFPSTPGGGVVDDHKFVNELAHIPTIDIISLSDQTRTGFAAHWHTHADDMPLIDKATLEAVGRTLLQVLYESAQNL